MGVFIAGGEVLQVIQNSQGPRKALLSIKPREALVVRGEDDAESMERVHLRKFTRQRDKNPIMSGNVQTKTLGSHGWNGSAPGAGLGMVKYLSDP